MGFFFVTNMKYNISINQMAFVKLSDKLDFNDAAIFDFIKDFAHSENCHKLKTNEGEYFWISHKIIIDNLPMLGIKSSRGILQRIDKLVNCNILEKHPESQLLGRSYYRFGANYDSVTFVPTYERKSEPLRINIPTPTNESSDYNNNKDYINNNNKKQEPLKMPFDSMTFIQKWIEWKTYKKVEHRFSFKSQYTEQKALENLYKISNQNETQAIKIIDNSIANGYKGLFPELKISNQKNISNPTNRNR